MSAATYGFGRAIGDTDDEVGLRQAHGRATLGLPVD
jgi:hypothetical protein